MSAPTLRDRLQAGLVAAMKGKDTIGTRAIRSALAAIGNAEAVEATTPAASGDAHIAGSARGLGAGDAPRRELTELDLLELLGTEITDRRQHAREYEALGQADAAARLRAEAALLESYCSP